MAKTDPLLVNEARRLRKVERLSNYEISLATGIPVGTLSPYLKDIPLDRFEISNKQNAGRAKGRITRATGAYRAISAKNAHFDEIRYSQLSTQQKGSLAEMCVRTRLMCLGYVPLVPDVVNLRYDIVVQNIKNGSFLRVQIKSAHWPKNGMPIINLASNNNGARRQYLYDDFDIVVAYNHESGRFFVIHRDDISERLSGSLKVSMLSLKPAYEDAWHKFDI